MNKLMIKKNFNLLVILVFTVSINVYSGDREKIFFIGIDGLGGPYLNKENTPNIYKWMTQESSYTLEMQNVLPVWTATNWFSMFSSSTTNLHNIKSNYHKVPPYAPPTYFKFLSKNYPDFLSKTFYSWESLGRFLGVDSPKHKKYFLKDMRSIEEVKNLIVSQKMPDFLFLYLGELDYVGHNYKWGSKKYLKKLKDLDTRVEILISLLKENGLFGKITLALSSDHGGASMIRLKSVLTHGGDQYSARSIPFIISGPKIKKGNLIKNEPRIFDIFPTFAKIQNIKKLPKRWVGRTMDDVFKNPFFEIFRGYKPTFFSPKEILVKKTKKFKTILVNKRGVNFKVLRPVIKGLKYYSLGDVIETKKKPRKEVIMVPLIHGLSSYPIAFEKILNNEGVPLNNNRFTTWSPIAPYGHVCPGEVIVPGLTTDQPPKDSVVCIKRYFLRKVKSQKIWSSHLGGQIKYGISFWGAIETSKLKINTFYSRRKKNMQGLNKGFELNEKYIKIK